MKGLEPILVNSIDPSTCAYEGNNNVDRLLLASAMQRLPTQFVHDSKVGTMLEEQVNNFQMLGTNCFHQGSLPIRSSSVDQRPRSKK